ncbi:MAG: Uma2 family endonuclease [Chromatiaceae bacterium]|nr:MAG: Uma2 family endonuclease [Chromatiaceae bacterium]
MTAQPIARLTFDDWLAGERAAREQRSEYCAGEVFAMTGASEAHNLIVANLLRDLGNQLRDKPCRVYPSDMKVHIAAADVGAYPDVMVICGERQFYDERQDVVSNPTLIVEVLSSSTEAYDRGDKFRHYRALPSLQAYLLLAQDRLQAELFVRQSDGSWNLTSFDQPSDKIALPAIAAGLILGAIYDKVELLR